MLLSGSQLDLHWMGAMARRNYLDDSLQCNTSGSLTSQVMIVVASAKEIKRAQKPSATVYMLLSDLHPGTQLNYENPEDIQNGLKVPPLSWDLPPAYV